TQPPARARGGRRPRARAGEPGLRRVLQVGQAEEAQGPHRHPGVRGLERWALQDHQLLRQARARADEPLRHHEAHRRGRGAAGLRCRGLRLRRRRVRRRHARLPSSRGVSRMQISFTFDAGAIEVVRLDDPADIRLRLRKDNAADFHQWFHFRLTGAAGKPVRMVFENAATAAYPDGWRDYRCVASYDRQHWFRIASTRYERGELIVEHTPECDSVYYAYFEPYSHERHLDLVARAEQSPHARVRRLGSTVDGRDLDLVVVGDEVSDELSDEVHGRAPIWIIARQHPGETMAEWFVEGLL